MTLSIPALLSVLFLPLLLGASALRALGFSLGDDKLAYFGWCYVAGCLATGLVLFLWLTIGLPLQATLLLPSLLGLALLLVFLGRFNRSASPTSNTESPCLLGTVLVLLLFILHGIVGGSALAVVSADGALIWSIKAKLIFISGGFNDAFHAGGKKLIRSDEFISPPREYAREYLAKIPPTDPAYQKIKALASVLEHPPNHHLDYPMLNPLLQVWTFLHAEKILHWENRLPIQCSLIASILVLAGALRRLVRPWFAAGLLILFVALHDTLTLARSCYADPMVGLGFLTAMDALLRWQKDRSPRWLRLLCLGLALMLWSKNEAMLYLVAVLIGFGLALACVRDKRRLVFSLVNIPRRELPWLAVPLLVIALTWTVNMVFGFRNDLVGGGTAGLSPFERLTSMGPERLGDTLGFFWSQIVAGPIWGSQPLEMNSNYLYFVLLCLVVIFPRRAFHPTRMVLTIALLNTLAGLFLVYLTTPHNLIWHLDSSAQRVTWQAIPSVILWVASMAAGILPFLSADCPEASAPPWESRTGSGGPSPAGIA